MEIHCVSFFFFFLPLKFCTAVKQLTALDKCEKHAVILSLFFPRPQIPEHHFSGIQKKKNKKATAALLNQENRKQQIECAMQRTRGCFKSKPGSRGCVAVWTCQTLIEREKDHRHSQLKITDTVLIELKLFRLYALNRAELTVRNNKCHMRNKFTLSSVWGYWWKLFPLGKLRFKCLCCRV